VLNHGAVVANYSPVASLIEGPTGEIQGARLRDGTAIRAKVVVDAGGVWAAEIADLAGPQSSGLSIRPAKGIHLTVPAHRLPCDYASVLAVPGDKRSIFVVPWDAAGAAPVVTDMRSSAGDFTEAAGGRFTYLGTTDTDYRGPLDEPVCTPEDVDYVLRTVNAWTSADLTAADVTGSWAGLRPLISDAHSARTADLSRRHRVTTARSGLVTVTGGKLTTYRRMAADTVDEVGRNLGRRLPRSPTRRLQLWGAEGFDGGAGVRGLAGRISISPDLAGHLARRYGSEARAVVALAESDPRLGAPLVPGLPYLGAEAMFAARYEMVHTLTDILSRRTRALILDAAAASAAADDVARLVGPELGWDTNRQLAEAEEFRALVRRERSAAGLVKQTPSPILGLA
nr:FAD-dependent oxidoreductase [Actinomycetota bacterium]